jgi:hypothetical protein
VASTSNALRLIFAGSQGLKGITAAEARNRQAKRVDILI